MLLKKIRYIIESKVVIRWRKENAYRTKKNTTNIYQKEEARALHQNISHDFSSNGIVSRVKGMTTGKFHHLLSNQELLYFYLLDWSEKTMDIREQFPLSELEKAIKIADSLGIRYPYDRKSGFPYVLTSDFLIITGQGTVARSVKLTKDLDTPGSVKSWKLKGNIGKEKALSGVL